MFKYRHGLSTRTDRKADFRSLDWMHKHEPRIFSIDTRHGFLGWFDSNVRGSEMPATERSETIESSCPSLANTFMTDCTDGSNGKPKVLRRMFSSEEDSQLVQLVTNHPKLPWGEIAAMLPGRSARQCRERWLEYLRPGIRVGPWTAEEDELLLRLIQVHGLHWTALAEAFAQRSANDIKNRWYQHVRPCVYRTPWGTLDFIRGFDGKPIQAQRKRIRKHKFPGKVAFEAAGVVWPGD
jgi:hypothetical protein